MIRRDRRVSRGKSRRIVADVTPVYCHRP